MEWLQDIIDATNLMEILKAFEVRLKKGIKKAPIKPGGYEKVIEKLDQEIQTWSHEETTRARNKFADDFFTRNIKDPEVTEDPSNWHKCL